MHNTLGMTEYVDDNIPSFTPVDDGTMRAFETGATRDTGEGKVDPEGFLSPTVMLQYYKFMNMNRLQSDGQLRDSDNWQKGIPLDTYMKSMHRHLLEAWMEHRNIETENGQMAALCGLLFNVMGYMHEILKTQGAQDFDGTEPTPEMRRRKESCEASTSQLRTATNQIAKSLKV